MIKPTLLGVVLLGIILSGCSLAGRTFGTYVDDKALTAHVKIGLARKDHRNLVRVNVDTYDGTVYLTGEVPTALDKSDAEIAAWQAGGINQVVNDLRVRAERFVAASPALQPPSPLLERLPGIVRLDATPSGAGALAYDGKGTVVATVYVRPIREVAQVGFEPRVPTERPIDHVTVYGMPAEPGAPEAQMYIVFWHVNAAAAAALR